jgi:hypothetical protein
MNLKHKDSDGDEHDLRTAPDVPIAVRNKGRVLGELWKLVLPHIEALPDKPTDFKLGCSNGKLFIIAGDRPQALFSAVTDDAGLSLVPHDKNLAKYHISAALAAAWADSAAKAASRAGQ